MRSANGTVITRPPKLSFLVHNAFDGDNPNFTFIFVWWKSVSPSVAATGDTTTGVHHEVRLSLFKRAWRVKNTANMADVCGVTRHAETSDGDGAHNGGSSKVPHYQGDGSHSKWITFLCFFSYRKSFIYHIPWNPLVWKRWRATWSFYKQFVYLLIRTYASLN